MTLQFAPQETWQPPPQPALFGELSTDGSRIILIAQGNSWDQKVIGQRLSHITALIGTVPGFSNAVTLPATWATVTQVARSFNGAYGSARWVPQPRLREWILAEWARRTAPPAPLIAEFPPWLKLRDYQEEGAAMIAAAHKFLLLDDPGLGKTCQVIAGLAEIQVRGGDIFPMVIIVPSWDVATVWQREIATWMPRWQTVRWGGPGRDISRALDQAGILLSTYATARIDASDVKGPLAALRPVTVVGDECVTHDTLIITPQGRQRICDLQAGDTVLGYDHENGQRTWTTVRGVMRSPLRPVTEVAGVHLTPEHPVFVTNSPSWSLSLCYANDYAGNHENVHVPGLREDCYPAVVPVEAGTENLQQKMHRRAAPPKEPAARIQRDLRMVQGAVHEENLEPEETAPVLQQGLLGTAEELATSIQRDLRMVQRAVHAEAAGSPETTPVLQQELLSKVADVPAGIRGDPPDGEKTGGNQTELRHSPPGSGCTEEASSAPRRSGEPVPGSSRPGESAHDSGRTGLGQPEWRKRDGAYYPAGEVARLARARLGLGAGDQDRDAPGLWLPGSLQSGHRPAGLEDRDRGAREGPRQDRQSAGPEETGAAGVTRLDGAVDLERADPGRSLWNLETGTGNYFAAGSRLTDGILVHNCHMVKATALATAKGNSTVSAAYRRICAHAANVIELSGTLITQDTGDIYVPLAAPWPLDFPDRKRFTNRYLETSHREYGEPKVEGLAPLAEPEFRTVLMGSMRRVAKADVLTQLPPKIYSVRYIDIPPEWREAYNGMERDMLAELPDSDDELPAFDSLVKFGRLSQLACSAADVEVTEELDELTGLLKKHYAVMPKAPCWKADVLLEILAERRGHPVAVFAPSRQLIEVAGQAYLEKAGYRTGYVTGTTPGRVRTAAIDGFQAGQLDVIALTTGAGGTGITLTAADTVVFLQRPWLGESIQSEDRAHRIGSEIHKHGVEIIDIVARDSIDDRRRELLREHGGQLASFVGDMRIIRGLLGGLK